MLAVLIFLFCLCLVALVCVEALACRFYLSAYARATHGRFKETVRDAHARLAYCVSRKLASGGGKVSKKRGENASLADALRAEPRTFFNVAIPLDDGVCAFADVVALSSTGVEVLCVQEGPGSLYGEASDDRWLFVGFGKRDGSERFVLNASKQASLAAAAIEAAMLDAGGDGRARANVVWGRFLNVSQTGICEAVRMIPYAQLRKTPVGVGLGEGELSEEALAAAYRLVKACCNANRASGSQAGFGAVGTHRGTSLASGFAEAVSPAGLRETIRQAYDEATTGEIVRAADRLVNDKENFDALTWQRVLQISGELEASQDLGRIADLAGELKLIARTNISVNYRFGIADAAGDVQLSPAGLAMQRCAPENVNHNCAASSSEVSSMRNQVENDAFYEAEDCGGDGTAGSRE